MKIYKVVFLIFIFLICGGVLFPHSVVYAQISPEISQLINNSRASNAFWAVQVRDSSGRVLQNLNGDKLIRPASNLKIVTSGALLERLGPQYRFETTLYGRGRQTDSTWVGDIIVKGSGDPSISGIFSNGDKLFLFEKWTTMLFNAGIKVIDGNLIGFDGLFDDVPYPKGWEWDDLTYYYAPEISALSFNSNVVDLEVSATGRIGSRPRIEWSPFNTPFVEFINEQTITPAGTRFNESYRRELGTNTIILRSTLPQGYYETEPLTVTAPSLYFMDTFYRYMELRGMEISGGIFIDSDYYSWSERGLQRLHTHLSEPLYKMIEHLNKESDNFFTEMLVKKLGSNVYNVQGTTELGLQVVKEFMSGMGFDTTAVRLRDGSGMAPATLLNAGDLNQYLVNVQQKAFFPHLFSSLAVGGVSGTLSHRFRGSRISENFYGKTGFVSGVRALSGYLDTETGNRLVVSIITNNYTAQTSHVDFIHQRILEYLYSSY
jgi:D-alanyl-D-alanine carboxypeptidase/D-alanyl-D-alanine-endopeptidase (penicillin-binding protein 4)